MKTAPWNSTEAKDSVNFGVHINYPFIRKSKVAPRKVRQNLVKDEREMKHQVSFEASCFFVGQLQAMAHCRERAAHSGYNFLTESIKIFKNNLNVFKHFQEITHLLSALKLHCKDKLVSVYFVFIIWIYTKCIDLLLQFWEWLTDVL